MNRFAILGFATFLATALALTAGCGDARSDAPATAAPATAAAASAPCWKKGRANASTSSRMAAHRIASSSQWRIRRRRTDWYGIRWRNISEGNGMTRFRSR